MAGLAVGADVAEEDRVTAVWGEGRRPFDMGRDSRPSTLLCHGDVMPADSVPGAWLPAAEAWPEGTAQANYTDLTCLELARVYTGLIGAGRLMCLVLAAKRAQA